MLVSSCASENAERRYRCEKPHKKKMETVHYYIQED